MTAGGSVCHSPSWHVSHEGPLRTGEDAVWGHKMDVSDSATYAVGQRFTVSLH